MADSVKTEGTEKAGNAKRELLIGAGGFVAFVVVAFGLLMFFSGGIFSREPSGEAPIDITVMHTNDVWGYLDATG